ncbi:hypothetical protein [Dermatophilus congolensis]|uniref:Arginine repressor n=1 Tax=Dermatophilus congolensis TaxID=1863 RepID=A0A239VFW4_9MICO|nr:hypothetical protein [Dermatophilus congolensis]MBO3128877.1 hypothetical protein [Dermatophilus congolensis]MBO3132485.1 hypothetical protein [Dermatophilus congolensis]MBO3133354.1 hypothetical protein [Dermatophilus congolensis]MBO3135589.1 hypothetical protein [Dermatophilus congolensis]MBO3137828.1 hypothetical protein [Dermatophilus congolensis]
MDDDTTSLPNPGTRWTRHGIDPTEPLREQGLWSSFQVINHRILIRTVAGGANYVARAVDRANFPGTLGTIAGNDSVLLICTDHSTAKQLISPLGDLLGPQINMSTL